MGAIGVKLTAANHAVITQMFWVMNEQCQAFGWVVQLGQNRVPHTRLLNTGPSGYDYRASDFHQLSGVAQMRVLHGLISHQDIMTSMIDRILEYLQHHMKLLTEQGDMVPSNGEDTRLSSGQWNRGTPLWKFNQSNITTWLKIVKSWRDKALMRIPVLFDYHSI